MKILSRHKNFSHDDWAEREWNGNVYRGIAMSRDIRVSSDFALVQDEEWFKNAKLNNYAFYLENKLLAEEICR